MDLAFLPINVGVLRKVEPALSHLIPSELKVDTEDHRKARLLMGSALSCAVVTGMLAGTRFAMDGASTSVGKVLGATALGFLLIPAVLKVTGRLRWTSYLLPLFGLIGVAAMAWVEGGLYSESLFFMPFVPLVGVLFLGRAGAWTFAGLGIAGLLVLLSGHLASDASFPPLVLRFLGGAGAVAFAGVLGVLYERGRARADQELLAAEAEKRSVLDALLTEKSRSAKLKDEFVSTISHELRTPLTKVRGTIGLLVGGALEPQSASALNLLKIAEESADRLAALIDDLLDIEKLETGDLEIRTSEVRLREFLAATIRQNSALAGEHLIQLKLEGEAPNVVLRVDQERLQKVMSSLISNAAKYSPEGASVRVAAESDGSHASISVTDEGPGIPQEFQHRIFEKFTQANSTSTRRVGGSGLGLHIARGIVESFGGSIDFESATNGTKFIVSLPTVLD